MRGTHRIYRWEGGFQNDMEMVSQVELVCFTVVLLKM